MERPRWYRSVGLVPVMLLALASCVELTGPTPPPDAVPMDVPAEYEHWWKLTEQCSGLTGNLGAVRWLVLEGVTSIPQHNAQAAWYSRGNQIVVVDGYQDDGRLVRHEMLHALLGRAAAGHPREYFVEACAGVVSCAGSCAEEAGPRPLYEGAPYVVAESLELSARVLPDTVSANRGMTACPTVVVSARNPHDHPVRLALPELPSGMYQVFGWRVASELQGLAVKSVDVLAFGAGETRQHVFDCVRIGGMGPAYPGLAPGQHDLYGSLLSAESARFRFTVVE